MLIVVPRLYLEMQNGDLQRVANEFTEKCHKHPYAVTCPVGMFRCPFGEQLGCTSVTSNDWKAKLASWVILSDAHTDVVKDD